MVVLDSHAKRAAARAEPLQHGPAARPRGKLPLAEPLCDTTVQHGCAARPPENCPSQSHSAARLCGTAPQKIASHKPLCGTTLRRGPLICFFLTEPLYELVAWPPENCLSQNHSAAWHCGTIPSKMASHMRQIAALCSKTPVARTPNKIASHRATLRHSPGAQSPT